MNEFEPSDRHIVPQHWLEDLERIKQQTHPEEGHSNSEDSSAPAHWLEDLERIQNNSEEPASETFDTDPELETQTLLEDLQTEAAISYKPNDTVLNVPNPKVEFDDPIQEQDSELIIDLRAEAIESYEQIDIVQHTPTPKVEFDSTDQNESTEPNEDIKVGSLREGKEENPPASRSQRPNLNAVSLARKSPWGMNKDLSPPTSETSLPKTQTLPQVDPTLHLENPQSLPSHFIEEPSISKSPYPETYPRKIPSPTTSPTITVFKEHASSRELEQEPNHLGTHSPSRDPWPNLPNLDKPTDTPIPPTTFSNTSSIDELIREQRGGVWNV